MINCTFDSGSKTRLACLMIGDTPVHPELIMIFSSVASLLALLGGPHVITTQIIGTKCLKQTQTGSNKFEL